MMMMGGSGVGKRCSQGPGSQGVPVNEGEGQCRRCLNLAGSRCRHALLCAGAQWRSYAHRTWPSAHAARV